MGSVCPEQVIGATTVLETILDKEEIPKTIVDKAVGVLVYPAVKKVGIGIGVTSGRGMITCRSNAQMNGKMERSRDGVRIRSSRGTLKRCADASAVADPSDAKASGFNDPNVEILREVIHDAVQRRY